MVPNYDGLDIFERFNKSLVGTMFKFFWKVCDILLLWRVLFSKSIVGTMF